MSSQQYIVLNEEKIKEMFWPVERELIRMGIGCGSAIKIFVVNDCCREDYGKLRDSLETDHER